MSEQVLTLHLPKTQYTQAALTSALFVALIVRVCTPVCMPSACTMGYEVAAVCTFVLVLSQRGWVVGPVQVICCLVRLLGAVPVHSCIRAAYWSCCRAPSCILRCRKAPSAVSDCAFALTTHDEAEYIQAVLIRCLFVAYIVCLCVRAHALVCSLVAGGFSFLSIVANDLNSVRPKRGWCGRGSSILAPGPSGLGMGPWDGGGWDGGEDSCCHLTLFDLAF